jgi:lysophospholipase L1-like esterase
MSLLTIIRTISQPLFAILLSLPALAQHPAPSIPSTGFAGLDEYRASRISIYTDDFGQLARYRQANASLAPPPAGESRVVFLGDSITDYWKLPDYFPGKPYINRGIDGQTTPQMLVRFRQDVIDLHPKVLVVLAGTNDIAGVTGRTSNEDIEANYASMAELARAHRIRVVFASILPVHNYTHDAEESFALRPRDRILALNKWLKDYCAKNRLVYLDYFSALVDERSMLKRALADDGLHPTDAGYKIMAPLAEKAIQKALSGKQSSVSCRWHTLCRLSSAGWPTLCEVCKGWVRSSSSLLPCFALFASSNRIHLQQSLSGRVERPTAPSPISRMRHQFFHDRICVHVLQLFF